MRRCANSLPTDATLLALLAFGLLIPSVCSAQSNRRYIIGTVVGSGPGDSEKGEYSGDGGPASAALLSLPTSVVIDRVGNLYLCDWTARIRKVAALTGIVTTVAGNGERGYSGDNGLATNAQLGGPGTLAIDAAGNIYFADPYNHRVRRIAADTGIITTIAGNGSSIDRGDKGLAIDAGIGGLSGIAVDAANNIYISNGADRVRKIEAATGIITTIAGSGGSRHSGDGWLAVEAQLHQPSAIAVDAAGNLYIAARGEHRIRKINAATGIITTVAGVSSGSNSGILSIEVYRGGFSGDDGPATNALLNNPEGIAVDSSGNLYISDTLNYRVRRIDAASGVISTVAGTGVKGYSGDGSPALAAKITTPAGIVVDPAGRIYFADLFNQRIRVLSPFRPM